MAIMLKELVCDIVTRPHSAALVVGGGDRPAELEITAEDARIVWRFTGLHLAEAPAPRRPSHLTFFLEKTALLEQRELFPPPQVEPAERYGLESPLTGEERWGGHSRGVNRPIGRYPVMRVFVACPMPAGFVADTSAASVLDLGWSAAGEEPRLGFHAELSFDPAPDKRWQEPVLELDMAPASYANLMAALEAIA